jgi:hypothetical protein
MPRRGAHKPRQKTVPQRAPSRGAITKAPPEGKLADRLAAAESERDALRAELERERERIRKLEEANAAAHDRVTWALDTLRAILDDKN